MEPFEYRCDPQPDCVTRVRHALARWLEAARVHGERAYDALLVATELVTNGVLHDGGDHVTFRAWRGRDSVSIEVHTVDSAGPPPAYLRRVDDPLEGGRGMILVEALTDEHAIHVAGAERTVSCRLSLATV